MAAQGDASQRPDDEDATRLLEAPRLFRRRRKDEQVRARPEAVPPHSDTVGPATTDPEQQPPAIRAPAAQQHHAPVEPEPSMPPTPPTARQVQHSSPSIPVEDPSPAAAVATPDVTHPRPPFVVSGHVAALLTGLLVGAVLVATVAGGLGLCESARGTSSCGAAGLPLLGGTVLLAFALGALLLRFLGVGSAGTISFLAVALVCVLSALFLGGGLGEAGVRSGATVLVLTAAAFWLFHWLTTGLVDAEPAD